MSATSSATASATLSPAPPTPRHIGLILLPVEFPAFYIAGLFALFYWLKDRALPREAKSAVIAFALAIAASLCAAWLLLSTLGENNDLGWRAVLPGVLLLMVFAAAGLSQLSLKSRPAVLAVAIVLILLGLPDGARIRRRQLCRQAGRDRQSLRGDACALAGGAAAHANRRARRQ